MIIRLLKNIYKEKIIIDANCIAILRCSLGEHRTREVIEEVMFHLVERIGRLDSAIAAGDAVEASAIAHRMAATAAQVGLVDLTRVARDLGLCLRCGDHVGAAAVSARLCRLADGSILYLLNYADRTAL